MDSEERESREQQARKVDNEVSPIHLTRIISIVLILGFTLIIIFFAPRLYDYMKLEVFNLSFEGHSRVERIRVGQTLSSKQMDENTKEIEQLKATLIKIAAKDSEMQKPVAKEVSGGNNSKRTTAFVKAFYNGGSAKHKEIRETFQMNFGESRTFYNRPGGCGGVHDQATCTLSKDGKMQASNKDSCSETAKLGAWVKEGCSTAFDYGFKVECCFADM